jgi:hypothetical protein
MVAKGRVPKGVAHYRARLTEEQVLEIIASKGVTPQVELAAKYGVTREAISRIHAGKNWKHLATPRAK